MEPLVIEQGTFAIKFVQMLIKFKECIIILLANDIQKA